MADVVLLLVGLVVGTVGTLVGAGGGFLLVPVLLFLYPDDPPDAITSTSLAVVFINASSGAFAYAYQRRIDYRNGVVLALATVPGSILGALLTNRIDRGPFTVVFSAVLLVVAGLLLRRPAPRERAGSLDPASPRRRVLVDRAGQVYIYSLPLRRAFVICLGIGFLSSLLGIGGGIIQVPLFILVFHFPTYIATATSQFMLAVMSFSGTATHLLAGDFADAARRTLLLAPGVIIGSQYGAMLSRRMRPSAIARLLAVMMILAAGRLLAAQVL